MNSLETDYLVVGAGAMGMAFADTLLSESDASITIVDRQHAPGGHWLDAYPFVRLHQPSSFYGVASAELGSRRIDQTGSNAGFFELASGAEVCAYFDRVMRQRMLPSGRVTYVPMSTWSDGEITNLLNGNRTAVTVRRRLVDATYLNTSIPATHKRKFAVSGSVRCIPPNELPRYAPDHSHIAILGAGKTAMDAGVWLLEHGADPEQITWVRPRDAWLINRATTQPGEAFFDSVVGGVARQMEAMASATSVDDLFERMEASALLLRIDPDTWPTMFHYATSSVGEIEQLRRLKSVVRNGHVVAVDGNGMAFQDGFVSLPEDTLYVDCTASAVERRPPIPVFDGNRITLQMIRLPQPTFSAAMIAHLEARGDDEITLNKLAAPVALPDDATGWIRATIQNMTNQFNWSQDQDLRRWINACRLDGFGALVRNADKSDPQKADILKRMRQSAFPAVTNAQRLLDSEMS